MSKQSAYQSRTPDAQGFIAWSESEHLRWQKLYQRQIKLLPGRACEQYMTGTQLLDLPTDRIPQLAEIDKVLTAATGWKTAPVPALINFTDFFTLLANKSFPVATFIRSEADFDYLQEPDIFHEIFGHCPLLTNPAFAHFTHIYGQLGLAANKEDRAFLARLYWFTVEFGLVQTADGLRIYGGGILSSPAETEYALHSKTPERVKFDILEVLRTPYRIDIMQPIYYVLPTFDSLFDIAEKDIMQWVEKAKALGNFAAKFPSKEKKAS